VQQQQARATEFFGRTYGEAMSLLVEARDYLAHREPIERHALLPPVRLRMSCETMRLTARLTQIMGWLLSQRAVYEGELTAEAALDGQDVLGDIEVCMADDAAGTSELPQRLRQLLERSRRLFIRVARLDELARRQID
jgi:regulator of CtrA degradation